MGLRTSEWAAQLPLRRCGHSARIVLFVLAVRAEDPGYSAYPSITSMAEALKVSRRTVQRALVELRELGLIRVGDQGPVNQWRTDRRPTVYDVLTPELLELEQRAAELEPT